MTARKKKTFQGEPAPGWRRKANGDIVRIKPKTMQQLQKERDSLLKLLSERERSIEELKRDCVLLDSAEKSGQQAVRKLEHDLTEALGIIKLKNQEEEQTRERYLMRDRECVKLINEVNDLIKRNEALVKDLENRDLDIQELLDVIQVLSNYVSTNKR